MNDPKIVYSVNLILGAILAGVMSRHWRLAPQGAALHYWIAAAWTLTLADLLFFLRAAFPYETTRMVPTLMVTVGQLVLIFAAQRTTEKPISMRVAIVILALHLLFQLGFVAMPDLIAWRSVGNALVWSALAFSAAWVLSREVGARSEPLMVALFVSVLVAFLEQRNRELRDALENVRQLSSMLPLCACCKKVRDDDGYWTQIEAYLANHHVNVTHSICEHCTAMHFATLPALPAVG